MTDKIQELLIAARKNQILEAAAKVFAHKGFHPTTIKDIAKEAGIADGTIYNYFENKTALLLGIFDQMTELARQDESLSQVTPGDFRSFMTAYLRPVLMMPKTDNFELFRIVISEVMVNQELREAYYQKNFEPTIKMAEQFIQQWADQDGRKSVDVSLTMRAIAGVVLGLILQRIMGDKILETRWDELPDFLTDLILDGLKSKE